MRFSSVDWPLFDDREEAVVLDALRSGNWWRNEGQWVSRFEALFGELEAAEHVIGVTNGTQALELALLGSDVRRGDGVLLPALTFYSSLSAVQRHGAAPVIADVDLASWNLAFPGLPESSGPTDVRAVLPVHFAGVPLDMGQLARLASARGYIVIQDAAHGPGLRVHGRGLAAFGGAVCYSFQQSKLLPGGEGGAVAFSDENDFNDCLLRQNCGRAPGDTSYSHSEVSSNLRMPELTGALLCAQLEKFGSLARRRAAGAALLRERLAQIEGLELQAVPSFDCAVSSYLVQARLSYPGADAAARDELVSILQRHGVPVNRVYPPLFELEAYWKAPEPDVCLADLRGRCPNAVAIGTTGISLHHRVLLASPEQQTWLAGLIEGTVSALRRAAP